MVKFPGRKRYVTLEWPQRNISGPSFFYIMLPIKVIIILVGPIMDIFVF